LVLSKWFVSDELSALSWFLHNAPLLEKLTLKPSKVLLLLFRHVYSLFWLYLLSILSLQVRSNLMKTVESYKPLEQSIAASHLQIVEIICKDADEILLKILKVLKANGIPQEKIRIQCSARKLSMNSHDSLSSCQYLL
jgi:hypothetical protein